MATRTPLQQIGDSMAYVAFMRSTMNPLHDTMRSDNPDQLIADTACPEYAPIRVHDQAMAQLEFHRVWVQRHRILRVDQRR